MARRWKIKPEGSTWGEFGDDNQTGRMAMLTPEIRLEGVAEARVGEVFSLSLPLEYPGGSVLSVNRKPPELRAGRRPDGSANYQFPLSCLCSDHVDVVNDDMVVLHTQYSTQWDALSHYGCEFDADGDGIAEQVYYNGFGSSGDILGDGQAGGPRARALGIENLATAGVQGRGVLVNLFGKFGNDRVLVGHDALRELMRAQNVEVRRGDFLCLYTGFADRIIEMGGRPDGEVLSRSCAALDGHDARLLQWITDTGIVAICADNFAVEAVPHKYVATGARSPLLPLHHHCLFKIGVHLGELWYFRELADWLAPRGRNAFLLTAPPLRLTGSVGSPVTPIATV